MKLRPARVTVSDHAILRYLERYCDIDVKAVRRHLRELATVGALHGAIAVKADGVRLLLREQQGIDGVSEITVTTVLPAQSGIYAE